MFDVVIPVYNRLISEIRCLDAINNFESVNKIIVCDNSEDAFCQMRNPLIEFEKIDYIALGGNQGLAAAYNSAICHLESDWCLIFDDDTPVDNEFLLQMDQSINLCTCDVLLPVVYANGRMISPSRNTLHFYWCPVAPPLGVNDISGINSGMAIRCDVFRNCRYDDSLFLDMIDHRFIEDVKCSGYSVQLAEKCVLTQSFSRDEWSPEGEMARYRLFSKDVRQFYRRYGFLYCLYANLRVAARFFQLKRKYGNLI